MENSQAPASLTLADWHTHYWFSPLQMVTVINPAWKIEPGVTDPVTADYPFMVELRHYLIKAGSQDEFPGMIANVYLDGMTRIMAQNDEKLGYMGDPNLRRLYYDKLIVSIKDMTPQTSAVPAYLKDTPSAQAPNQSPPWQAPNMETASDVPPVVAPTEPKVETPPAKPENKEFELEGVKYKLIVDKNGKEMYYKAGKMTNAADFYKAASML